MEKAKVLVIDAGLGNIGSVVSALERENCSVTKRQTPPCVEELQEFTHAVLPGVGSFYAGAKALDDRKWNKWIREDWKYHARPLLGICLGMQLLATEGSEGSKDQRGYIRGLDMIPGRVELLPTPRQYPLPHVGWNYVQCINQFEESEGQAIMNGDYYFVHSYRFVADLKEHLLATTCYGSEFASAVSNGNFIGVQFHPEKSQRLGKAFIRSFLAR